MACAEKAQRDVCEEYRKALQHLVNYADSTCDESMSRSHAFRNAFKVLYGKFPDEMEQI